MISDALDEILSEEKNTSGIKLIETKTEVVESKVEEDLLTEDAVVKTTSEDCSLAEVECSPIAVMEAEKTSEEGTDPLSLSMFEAIDSHEKSLRNKMEDEFS